MLITIISLLLVILLVLLLHLYARWFLSQAAGRLTSTTTTRRGRRALPSSIFASLPLFVHKLSPPFDSNYVLECAICLSVFQEEEIGRKLPGCGHAFHVECIDMWLHSHSTCPICRAAILIHYNQKMDNDNRVDVDRVEINVVDQEQLEIDNAVRVPKSTNTLTEFHSGPSCSSSEGPFQLQGI